MTTPKLRVSLVAMDDVNFNARASSQWSR